MNRSSDPDSRSPSTVRIIFVGNSLAGDDGVGLHLLERIRRTDIPPGIELVEGATTGIALLEHLLDVQRVVIVDAVASAGPPGIVVRLDPAELQDPGRCSLVSCHDLGVETTLELARRLYPARLARDIVILGVTAHPATHFDTSLSPPVQAALPELERELMTLIDQG